MPLGRRSKWARMSSTIFSSAILPVPKVLTIRLTGLARRCEVQFAYAIGVAEPVSMLVDTFGTGVVADDKLTRAVIATFDARPGMLIKELDLRRPIFRKTAAYGHFGRDDADFTWEKTPLIEKLKDAAHSGNGVAANGKAAAKKAKGKSSAPARV